MQITNQTIRELEENSNTVRIYRTAKDRSFWENKEDSQAHYSWCWKVFPLVRRSVKVPENIQIVVDALCNHLGIPSPEIIVSRCNWEGKAVTLTHDKTICFSADTLLWGVVAHEFSHWYLWKYFYKEVDHPHHNTFAMRVVEKQMQKLFEVILNRIPSEAK